MPAHNQGAPLNAAQLAASLAVHARTLNRHIDLLADLLLVRRLPPWSGNVGKRLVRSPRLYARDSGIVHALLGLRGLEDVLSHPVAGDSGRVSRKMAFSCGLGCAGKQPLFDRSGFVGD